MNPPATLRIGDGFRQGTPHLMPEVERLQRALVRSGVPVPVDGLFGAATATALRRFQRTYGLAVDGIAGPATWARLDPPRSAPPHGAVQGLESFRGDLDWIHLREGHVGKPYWPGGISGVTLDPGYDLGFWDLGRTRELYGASLSPSQYRALEPAFGLRAEAARDALHAISELAGIRTPRALARRVMPHVAVRYWIAITRRFPSLAIPTTPPSVQTALLSLAYNRGARNGSLSRLEAPLSHSDWLKVADEIASMQQNHRLPGVRARRRAEAELIALEVGR